MPTYIQHTHTHTHTHIHTHTQTQTHTHTQVRVFVHANPSPDASTRPVLVFEGAFAGSPPSIALACTHGNVSVQALLADKAMGAMHPKSFKGDLLMPVRDCLDLRPVALEEGAPIKVWVEVRGSGDGEEAGDGWGEEDGRGWIDCGAWDGLLGVHAFVHARAPARVNLQSMHTNAVFC